jgi:N6-L-threonylcarbamoyladenine synthase
LGLVPVIVLGIESSCDETACGIVKDGRQVLASQIASQIEIHRKFGGVVPEIASRQHLAVIDATVVAALTEARLTFEKIDAIAVTQGPGLIGALLVGISYAKGLAASLDIPLIPVDHVHAHVHGALLERDPVQYPCLALVVSGGHTNLYWMPGPLSFELIARSVDDACGECFDKVAKVLGMPYPGGPLIEAQAQKSVGSVELPMPRMIENKARLEFSYSGLKTHMINLIRKQGQPWIETHLPEVCRAFQDEALGQIVRKLKVAIALHPAARGLLIAGGVSANERFKELLSSELQLPVIFPNRKYCSDNGAMIASIGWHHWQAQPDPHVWDWRHDWDAYSRYNFIEKPQSENK